MYLSHYSLTEKPFQLSPDPRFLWLGEIHKEALATLRYGILENRGLLLIVGDVGTGKTSLINGFLSTIDEDTIAATIFDPGLENGGDIPIEERDIKEVTNFMGLQSAPRDINVKNPAFDVTPHELISGIITERGIISPPFADKISEIKC